MERADRRRLEAGDASMARELREQENTMRRDSELARDLMLRGSVALAE
jgi:hypothetical protein